MTFADQLAADTATFFNAGELGLCITYKGQAITVVPAFDANLERVGESLRARAVISVRKSDVPQWVYRDEVVMEGRTWFVMRARTSDELVWNLELYADERPRNR